LFVGAITKGFVIGTVPFSIEMKCGSEILRLKDPNYNNLDFSINTGTKIIMSKNDLILAMTTQTFLTSTIDLSICPFDQTTLNVE
jgi:hypothetical protein